MGSCASVNVKANHQHLNDMRSFQVDNSSHLYCKKHAKNTVTHINEKTLELVCLNCFRNATRGRGDTPYIHEINSFVNSIQFKQSEIQTIEKVRGQIRRHEQRLLQVTQIKTKLENKRKQILEEIQLFVKTVIELLKHFEEDLCQEVKEKITAAESELRNAYSQIDTHINKCKLFTNNIEANRTTGNGTYRVDTVLKCKKYLNTGQQTYISIKDYVPILKLNRTLTLSEIVGKGRNSKSVRLGSMTIEGKGDIFDNETLSDISEEPETTDYSRSSTQPGSTINASSTQQSHVGVDSVGESTGTSTVTSLDGSLSVSDQNREVSRQGIHEISHSHMTVSQLKDRDALSSAPTASDKETCAQRRAQFVRESSISRQFARRISNSGTPHRVTPTPRRSAQSIISPGNINTPLFITARKESMARRIAVKIREIRLSDDAEVHNITDTLQLNETILVLCDQRNEKLVLLGKDLNVLNEISMKGHPHNIAKVPGPSLKVAVTIPDENVIKVVEVENEEFSDSIHKIVLKSKPRCRGIDFINGNMLYTTRNDVAIIKKNDAERAWKFKYAFREPVSLHADPENDVIFVSCLGLKTHGEVVKMHYSDEKIDFVISCQEIQHPVCTTSDAEGYIYVCDCDPPSVHQVSQDGRYLRRLLSSSQGNFQHVNFLKGTDTFIVTENDSNIVSLYEMT